MKYLDGAIIRWLKTTWASQGLKTFASSLEEAFSLTFLALVPLMLNIGLGYVDKGWDYDWRLKIVPGELVSYSMSFIATPLYLFVKASKARYFLPLVGPYFLSVLFLYIFSVILYLVLKNQLITIDKFDTNDHSPFFYWSLFSFGVTILFRVYAIYHGKAMSNFPQDRKKQQVEFNSELKKKIKEQQ